MRVRWPNIVVMCVFVLYDLLYAPYVCFVRARRVCLSQKNIIICALSRASCVQPIVGLKQRSSNVTPRRNVASFGWSGSYRGTFKAAHALYPVFDK